MERAHLDASGTPIRVGDVVQSVNDWKRRGVVMRSGDLYLITCNGDNQMLTFRLDDSQEWRIIDRVEALSEADASKLE